MKKIFIILLVISLLALLVTLNGNSENSNLADINSDSIVVDYDGNIYHTITIGSQVWLKENIKSLHYSDGTIINGALAYNNSDSLANIYGRLYSWNNAMRNSTTPGAQGVCPAGYHIPTDSEWTVLGNYLGGNNVAGGKMKETDTIHWFPPNTGATNSSGFTALGAGENEAGTFQFMKNSAVFWTSTQTSSTYAYYRFIQYNSTVLTPWNWEKYMAYSVRAIKNSSSIGINGGNNEQIFSFVLKQNYPNPFNNSTRINYFLKNSSDVIIKISDATGKEIFRQMNCNQKSGNHFIIFDASDLSSGIYFYRLEVIGNNSIKEQLAKSMLLIK